MAKHNGHPAPALGAAEANQGPKPGQAQVPIELVEAACRHYCMQFNLDPDRAVPVKVAGGKTMLVKEWQRHQETMTNALISHHACMMGSREWHARMQLAQAQAQMQEASQAKQEVDPAAAQRPAAPEAANETAPLGPAPNPKAP